MGLSDGVADLHMHTTASDGTCSVSDRVQQALEGDLEAIAITDHDTISEGLDGRVANQHGLELITGVEVRSDVQDTKVELLGYYIDPTDPDLITLLKRVREYRRDRNREIIERLNQVTSLDRTYGDVRIQTDGILGRPHIAEILVEEGIASSIGNAFEEYLGDEGEAFVPMQRVSASVVIDTLQAAGGVVSLAHPGRIRTTKFDSIIETLVEDGLDAIEVPYPYAEDPKEGYSQISSEDAARYAEELDLIQTGGSDCHGPGSGKNRIGEVRVGRDHLRSIRKLASERGIL